MAASKFLWIEIKNTNTIENYLFGYIQSTEILYKEIIRRAKNPHADTSLIIPYLFVVRHSVELMLKILLIRKNSSIKGFSFKGPANTLHNLSDLTNQILLSSNDKVNLTNLLKIVTLYNFDKDGKYFVYPIKKDLTKSLKNTKISNLQQLHKKITVAFKEFFRFIEENYPEILKEQIDSADSDDLKRINFNSNL